MAPTPTPRTRRAAAALAAALALGCAGAHAGRGAGPAPDPAREVAVNEVVELRLGAPAAGVSAEVIAPSGARLRAAAFPVPGGAAVRLRPREPGRHAWIARSAAGAVLGRGALVAEDRGLPGQVVAAGGALRTEDGRPFRPLGENRFNVYDPAWSDGLSAEAYVARMAGDGMNALRVFVFTACGRPGGKPEPGCLEPSLGAFDEAAARRYDAIFAAAERHGVRVILSIFAIGFTPGDAWKGWEENPYAEARGGPAARNTDFFLDPRAREAAKARLRYVLARWGASPALLAVDLLNEPEWDGAIPEDHWIPWAEELARTWRAEDPWGHPVTAGPVGLHWNVEQDERAWWSSPACDVVQWHRYGPDVHDVHDLAEALVGTARDLARYGKPLLVGEFGWGGDPKPAHDHTHVGIWAATFAGAGVLSHSAPPFTEDSDEPMTPARARHFRTLAAFLRRAEAAGPLAPAPDPEVRRVRGLRALALAGERAIALWLHAPRSGYGAEVRGAVLSLAGAAPGRWRVTWIDDVTGATVASEEVVADGGLSLSVPPFARHLAALAERL